MHSACQPGGQLSEERWYISSLTANDFILAAMIISLTLNLGYGLDTDSTCLGRRGEMIELLETSYQIFSDSKENSTEAHKASEALAVMLGKIKRGPSNGHGNGKAEHFNTSHTNVKRLRLTNSSTRHALPGSSMRTESPRAPSNSGNSEGLDRTSPMNRPVFTNQDLNSYVQLIDDGLQPHFDPESMNHDYLNNVPLGGPLGNMIDVPTGLDWVSSDSLIG